MAENPYLGSLERRHGSSERRRGPGSSRPDKQESVLRDINVNVRCSCCGDTQKELQEILELVKQIKKEVFRQSAAAEVAEAAAVHGILEPGTARLEDVAASAPLPTAS